MGVIIKTSEIKPGTSGIYKINFPDGKIYIGKSNDIRRRIIEHRNDGKKEKCQLCDKKIQEYNMNLEEIEILEYIEDIKDLDKAEMKWEKILDARNPEIGYNIARCGFGGSVSIFNDKQILDIRKRRFKGERKINVYNSDYSNYSFSTFEKVWLGITAPHIGKEYLIEKNSISRQVYSSIANKGENNGKAKLNENDVINIRKLYESEGKTVKEISLLYTQVSIKTIRRVCNRETWKHVI